MSDSNERSQPTSEELASVERRDEGRFQIVTEVTMKSLSNFTALGTDLSVGGIYIVTPHQLEEGTLVDIEFEVEGFDTPFDAVGEVRWSRRQSVGEEEWWGYGLSFQDLSEEEREQLDAFVRRREPLEQRDPPSFLDDD